MTKFLGYMLGFLVGAFWWTVGMLAFIYLLYMMFG